MYPGAGGPTKFYTVNSSINNENNYGPPMPHHHNHQPNYSSIIEEIPQHSTTSNHTHTYNSPNKQQQMIEDGDSPLMHDHEVDETDDEIYKHIR